jgi:hypothetical protein
MDLRVAVYNLAEEIKGVLLRLGTEEVETLSRADLHALEVYCYLLDRQIKKAKAQKPSKTVRLPPFPPFKPDKDSNET